MIFWEAFDSAAQVSEDSLENKALLHTVRINEAVTARPDQVIVPQPTWGYYVFLTTCDQTSRDSLPCAMDNWVKAIWRQHSGRADPPSVLAAEALRRFKLDLVDEQDTLESASIDRVRACFRTLVRSRELSDREDDWVPPTCNRICLIPNADKVQMLCDLPFHEDRFKEFAALDECRVQAVDIEWERPKATTSDYRGVTDVSVVGLGRAYDILRSGASSLENFNE